MRTLCITLLAALLVAQPIHAQAFDNDNDPHGCVNPAGHERGWCKHGDGNDRSSNFVTVSGTVVASNGDIATFREDNGSTIPIDERNLLASGTQLQVGAHYVLRGYWSNNLFVVQSNNNRYYNGYGGNGSPYPGNANASVQGIITAVSGNRVTIMQGLFSSVTVNDSQALNNGSAANLFVGRSVTAYGYWNGGTFYATSIG